MKTDARVKYTKMVIRSSFLELLKKTPVERITVAEICRIAEINRATFYRHYSNQYELLSAMENEMFDEIKKSAYEYRGDIDKLTEMILRKFSEQKETWSLLLSDHADLGFLSKIYTFFDGLFVSDNATKERELRYRFLLYGYSGTFDHWVKSGMKETPEEMASYLSRFRHDLVDDI